MDWTLTFKVFWANIIGVMFSGQMFSLSNLQPQTNSLKSVNVLFLTLPSSEANVCSYLSRKVIQWFSEKLKHLSDHKNYGSFQETFSRSWHEVEYHRWIYISVTLLSSSMQYFLKLFFLESTLAPYSVIPRKCEQLSKPIVA